MREVRLDRAHAHEELGSDLLVRPPLRCELGDSPLRLGQLVGGRRATADPSELCPCLLGPEAGSELLEDGERSLERLAGRPLLLGLPAHDAKAEERAGALERVRMLLELGQGVLEGSKGRHGVTFRP